MYVVNVRVCSVYYLKKEHDTIKSAEFARGRRGVKNEVN
jgi:hypothetical protein